MALAARLSECGNQTVVVLEAGQNPEIIPEYKVPGNAYSVLGKASSTTLVFNLSNLL